MDHEGDVLSGHVAPFDEAVVRYFFPLANLITKIFDCVFVICSESRGQRALWIVLPVGVISNVDIYLSGVILVEVNCGDCTK